MSCAIYPRFLTRPQKPSKLSLIRWRTKIPGHARRSRSSLLMPASSRSLKKRDSSGGSGNQTSRANSTATRHLGCPDDTFHLSFSSFSGNKNCGVHPRPQDAVRIFNDDVGLKELQSLFFPSLPVARSGFRLSVDTAYDSRETTLWQGADPDLH